MDDFTRWAENQRRIANQKKMAWRKSHKEQVKGYDVDWQRFLEVWTEQMYMRRYGK